MLYICHTTKLSFLVAGLLEAVRDHHSAPHIVQLLLRIDCNRYFITLTCIIDLYIFLLSSTVGRYKFFLTYPMQSRY